MTTKEIIGKLKQRRQDNVAKSQSRYKEKIQELRKAIVKNSFNKSPNLELHSQRMAELEETKLLLKQVNAFGG